MQLSFSHRSSSLGRSSALPSQHGAPATPRLVGSRGASRRHCSSLQVRSFRLRTMLNATSTRTWISPVSSIADTSARTRWSSSSRRTSP